MIRTLWDFLVLLVHVFGLILAASLALIALALPKR